MNWEFLLGILLPAYGFAYVWLIRTAREDPPLYKLVAKKLGQVCIVLISMIAGLMWWLRHEGVFDDPGSDLIALPLVIVTIVIIFTAHSISFFNRIANLPPKSNLESKPLEGGE